MPIRAITLDLDDTLWPIGPTIARAERKLHAWLEANAPAVADAFPIERMREVRDEVVRARPELHHDLRAIRVLTIRAAFDRAGGDMLLVDAAVETFARARSEVDPFPDAFPALAALAARYPIAAVSNGFADVRQIGIAHHFRVALSAAAFGIAKPDPAIFHAACAHLGCAPDEVLHVGDDPEADIIGARRAGLQAAWINRRGESWFHGETPHVTVTTLEQLVAWLDEG